MGGACKNDCVNVTIVFLFPAISEQPYTDSNLHRDSFMLVTLLNKFTCQDPHKRKPALLSVQHCP